MKRRVTREPAPNVTLAGRVIAKSTGAPIEGIEVYLDPTAGRIRLNSRSGRDLQPVPILGGLCAAVTDGNGMFWLEAPAKDAVWVTCVGDGWSAREAQLRSHDVLTPLVAEGSFAELPQAVVEMERAARIEGHVAGAPEGAFARATFVGGSLLDEGLHRSRQVAREMAGDQYVQTALSPSGEFVLTGLPGRTPLTLALVGSAAKDAVVVLQELALLVLQPGEDHRVDWSLDDRGSIACMVHGPGGVPVPGVELWLIMPSQARRSVYRQNVRPVATVTTDAYGRAMIPGVSLGEWAVVLAPADTNRRRSDDYARYGLPCIVARSGEVVPIELELRSDLYIEGVVRGPKGEFVNADVFARTPQSLVVASALEREGGRFRVGPLRPGRHTLQVRLGIGSEVHALVEPLAEMVEAGAVGVELRLASGARLVVRTIDAMTGEALPAETSVRPLAGGGQSHSSAAKWETAFTNLTPGRHTVRSSSADGRVGVAEVELPFDREVALELGLKLGGILELRNVDTLHAAAARVERGGQLIVERELAVTEAGLWSVAPGKYVVIVNWLEPVPPAERPAAQAPRRYDFEIRAGNTETLELLR